MLLYSHLYSSAFLHSAIAASEGLKMAVTSHDEVLETSRDTDTVFKHRALQLQNEYKQITSEFSAIDDLPVEDLDAYLTRLKGELSSMTAENAQLSTEIEDLTRKYAYLSVEKAKDKAHLVFSACEEAQMDVSVAQEDSKYEDLKLSLQLEKNEKTLKLLQDLESVLARIEAMEKIEDALAGVKVINVEGNCIRFSIRTYIPNFDGLFSIQKIEEDIISSLEQNHELLLEVFDGTMQIKNVKIFPNDIYIAEIIDGAKSFRQQVIPVSVDRSILEWVIRRVQDRIVIFMLRQLLVNSANLRHSFEYIDKDEMIVARAVGGVDAYIKMSPAWPLSNSSLLLKSLKSSTRSRSHKISLSSLRKVEELANSLDAHIRQDIPTFVDAIEEILVQHTHADNNLKK